MERIFLIALFFALSMSILGQHVVVVDSLDKTPLSFVAIKYSGGGLYTNEIGKFNLEDIKGNRLQLSLLGYKT